MFALLDRSHHAPPLRPFTYLSPPPIFPVEFAVLILRLCGIQVRFVDRSGCTWCAREVEERFSVSPTRHEFQRVCKGSARWPPTSRLDRSSGSHICTVCRTIWSTKEATLPVVVTSAVPTLWLTVRVWVVQRKRLTQVTFGSVGPAWVTSRFASMTCFLLSPSADDGWAATRVAHALGISPEHQPSRDSLPVGASPFLRLDRKSVCQLLCMSNARDRRGPEMRIPERTWSFTRNSLLPDIDHEKREADTDYNQSGSA